MRGPVVADERVTNIGERGANRRRLNGWISLVVGGAVAVALIVLDPPRIYRLLLAVPVGIAALNLLEAREKT